MPKKKQARRIRPIRGVELPEDGKPLHEPRLWGSWKSDRRKTFEFVRLKGTEEGQRKFRALFGKLVHTWTRTTLSSYFDCDRFMQRKNDRTPEVQDYSVIARSARYVVIRSGERSDRGQKSDPIAAEVQQSLDEWNSLMVIEFDGEEGYRVSLGPFFEYFRRIE